MQKEEHFTLINSTKAKLPRLAFAQMKEAVLGTDYELSLMIVNEGKMCELNKEFRNINSPTDILSFPFSDTEGEMYINLEETKKEAAKFNREYENFLGYLFIHGLVHLKGFDHSEKMEEEEIKFRKLFNI